MLVSDAVFTASLAWSYMRRIKVVSVSSNIVLQ
jgi:hypothetical protein